MSRTFDSFYRSHINAEHMRNFHRYNPKNEGKTEEKKPKRNFLLPEKKKTSLTEDAPGMPGAGMPPDLGGGPGGPGGAPMPPMAPPPVAAAKAFTAILMDAKNWLEQQKIELGDLPLDSPEMATLHTTLGLVTEYTPAPGETNTMVADKVAILSQQLGQLFQDGGTGEMADYIRALSAKLIEFRTTIDVSAETPPVAAPEAPVAPKGPPKPPAQNPNQPAELEKGLEITGGVR